MSAEMTEVERFTSDPENMRLFQQERVILETTELISDLMNRKGVTKAKLAERLGSSKSYVTQLLDGRTNMTLRTISDVMWALESSLALHATTLSIHSGAPEDFREFGEGRVVPWFTGLSNLTVVFAGVQAETELLIEETPRLFEQGEQLTEYLALLPEQGRRQRMKTWTKQGHSSQGTQRISTTGRVAALS